MSCAGAIGIVTLSLFVFGIRYLPLSTAYTLFFVAPLIITTLVALRAGVSRCSPRADHHLHRLRRRSDRAAPTRHASSPGRIAIASARSATQLSADHRTRARRTDSTQSMVFWVLTMMGFGGAALAAPGLGSHLAGTTG